MINGTTLIEWGFKPGPLFKSMINGANDLRTLGRSDDEIIALLKEHLPVETPKIPLRETPLPYSVFLEPENAIERDNLDKVKTAMDTLMRVPTVVAGVVMPDACPAGTIPVGGVVATKGAIHPGFHSADVCCSMAITVLDQDVDLKLLLDTAQSVTHFGPGARKHDPFKMPMQLADQFRANRFLADAVELGDSNLGTQGDGNHFLYVGRLRSTGLPAIVTHHGSRGVGALLYKRGMLEAKKHTKDVSPATPEGAAWIDAFSQTGAAYWEALQIVRKWTRLNHAVIHDKIRHKIGAGIADAFWNEHNFVFLRDGLFYHAKGATPSFRGFSPDDAGRTLIPMNMAEPILITVHRDKPEALGFAPHGAGRNFSRTNHMKMLGAKFGDARGISPRDKLLVLEEETQGLDVRSYSGKADLSELPSAYKSAAQVRQQIAKHDLAEVVDHVDPYGSIMAGEIDWTRK